MHQRKSKKILIYFFLLVLFGSINNVNFIKYNKKINLNISGLDHDQNQNLIKKINFLNLKNIFFLNGEKITRIIESNSLVQNYKIYKNYPNTLYIKIEKTNFFARINKNGKIYLVGSNGKLSDNKFFNESLPYVFGKPNLKDFLALKEIIDKSYISYENIKNLYFFKSKRWDLELKNKIIIKLPKDNIKVSLNNAFEFFKYNNFNNIKTVDLRINNQIISNE